MYELKILLLLGVVLLTTFLVARFRMMPLIAIILATLIFGVLAGSEPPWIAKGFNIGFGQTLAMGGLALVAGAMVAALGAASGAAAWWQARLRERGVRRLALGMAFFAGLGGSTIGALSVLTPALSLAKAARTRLSLTMTATVHAAQGALLPSPLPIAALAILEGSWRAALIFGLPLFLVQLAVGWAYARRGPDDEAAQDEAPALPMRPAAIGLITAMVVLIALVIIHALGQIPSEPFGSGGIRERLIGAGRPMLLLLAGLLLSLAFMGRQAAQALSDTGPLVGAARSVAGVLLAVGAAGGFQMVLHFDGFSELVIERIAELPPMLGLVIPFLVALVSRALQGSALTAAITAAGIMQPLVGPMGLGSEEARALMALACAIGAMALPHFNDGGFWLASHQAGLRAPQGLLWITGGALLQALTALVLIITLSKWAI
ncbi:MAG: hypothetical protein CFE31_16855 [Rhizobiales bacterium PAR1]|nr:MAG: hypothetical protein CFE31_16855 [Rhizobiales bacterium PAR1]